MNLDAVKDYKVLLVGDAIIDLYQYVRPLGKSIKENTLSVLFDKKSSFRGGVWAAAEHVKGFCATVEVQKGEGVMWSTRLVDEHYTRKLITFHERKVESQASELHDIRAFDLVIVTDFGYGTLTKELIEKLTKEARFLAVNAQTNSSNFGFNLITKYPRADYVVIDEMEARLAAHDRDGEIEDVILKLGFKNIIVTRGVKGAVGFDGAFERQGAMTTTIIDSMGAGDAFLSITAPFACAGFTMRDLLRIGNAAGAIKIGNIGQKAVTKEELRGRLEH